MATLTFHHSASDVSIASSTDAQQQHSPDEPTLDSGIRLPPGADVFPVEIAVLRPTQLAVGAHMVGVKAAKVRRKLAKGPAALDAFLRANPVPVVVGPGQALYLIDHHHLAAALHACGVSTCYAGVARDLSARDEEGFWAEMAAARCLWPHAHDGVRVEPIERLPSLLPLTVENLQDDPYRSLAALARKAGAFQKSSKPFAEFLWANFLRARVPLALEAPSDVVNYVGRAVAHATSEAAAAARLPGYTPLAALDAAALDLMADLGGAADAGGGAGGGGKGGDGDSGDGEGGAKKEKKKKKAVEEAAADAAAAAEAPAGAAAAAAATAEEVE